MGHWTLSLLLWERPKPDSHGFQEAPASEGQPLWASLWAPPRRGPHGQGIGRGGDAPSKPSAAVATGTFVNGKTSLPPIRRLSSEGAPSRNAGFHTSVPPDPDPGLPPGGSLRHVQRSRGPRLRNTSERPLRLSLVFMCFPSR